MGKKTANNGQPLRFLGSAPPLQTCTFPPGPHQMGGSGFWGGGMGATGGGRFLQPQGGQWGQVFWGLGGQQGAAFLSSVTISRGYISGYILGLSQTILIFDDLSSTN